MKNPVLTHYEVAVDSKISEPIRIAHVSDLHERRSGDILALVKEAEPDIIAVTGDTYERYDNRPQYDFDRRPVKRAVISAIHYVNYFLRLFEGEDKKAKTVNSDRFLSEAAQIAPVYMSLGNHEQKLLSRDYRFFENNGINLLDNADMSVDIKGSHILIGGMSTWDYEDFLERFKAKKGFKLMLCHHPERFEPLLKDTDIDLVLSGHTHGGQVRIGKKGMGFFVPGQSLFGKIAHGMFFGGRLIVSAGCSNTVAMPRLFNPRELVVVDLIPSR